MKKKTRLLGAEKRSEDKAAYTDLPEDSSLLPHPCPAVHNCLGFQLQGDPSPLASTFICTHPHRNAYTHII